MAEPHLPDKLRSLLEDFVKKLRNVYGDGLVSVILYGSTASGEYAGAQSNVNLAIVLDNACLPNLAGAAALLNKYRFRAIKPVFFTEKYIAASTDVFPLEFLDMKENHILLHGKDVLKNLRIDSRNLRFQCEQELKSKLINIKTAYISIRTAAGRRKLLFRLFTSSLHILRSALKLKGLPVAYSKEDIINEIAKEFGMDAGVSKKILAAKNGTLRLDGRSARELLFAFSEELETIADKVNGL